MSVEAIISAKSGLTIGQMAAMACIWEATAAKPGNVHRGADFGDLTYLDMTLAAVAIAPALDRAAAGASLGRCVLDAVTATRGTVATNANLGTILLLAPLARVPVNQSLASGVVDVLASLDAADSRLVYEAIRLARPGGLGEVPDADVWGDAPRDLVAAMRLAADRDLVARQYANGFCEVLDWVVPVLRECATDTRLSLAESIILAHVRMMAEYPDSLIARKCGAIAAAKAAALAKSVLAAGTPGTPEYASALADLDFWLRADGNRRNPGTTADLIAAGLFACLRDGVFCPPLPFYLAH
jgi:triphosphoribosyl-dephospho-CoA synthase